MGAIIQNTVRKFKNLDKAVADYYPSVDKEHRNELTRELWSVLYKDYPISDVISIVNDFEADNGIEENKLAYDILDEVIDLLDENTANAKRILEMLTYDIHWYTAFLRLISWDKALLNDKDFEALVAVGKAFCYRWDGNEWINENI